MFTAMLFGDCSWSDSRRCIQCSPNLLVTLWWLVPYGWLWLMLVGWNMLGWTAGSTELAVCLSKGVRGRRCITSYMAGNSKMILPCYFSLFVHCYISLIAYITLHMSAHFGSYSFAVVTPLSHLEFPFFGHALSYVPIAASLKTSIT